ncbi:MAG: hypothetical protein JSS27_15455 [Planctomycetes bacterium]|nr:hypothetical protein [Planctomycetota bacterium]
MDELTAIAAGRKFDPIKSLLGATRAKSTKKPKKPKEPTEAERDEQESLVADLGGKTLSALGWIGGSLDKALGGRAIRTGLGLATGHKHAHARDLLSIIPFSDTIGITNPGHDLGGRDVLESAGMLAPNKPGLDWGDVGGEEVHLFLSFAWPAVVLLGAVLFVPDLWRSWKYQKANKAQH